MTDLASRLDNRVQLSSDGHKAYLAVIEGAFGADIDYAMLVSSTAQRLKPRNAASGLASTSANIGSRATPIPTTSARHLPKGKTYHADSNAAFYAEVTTMADQQKLKIIDDVGSNEIYVNKIIGSSYDGTVVGITLGCTRIVPELIDTMPSTQPAIYVIGRLSLSPAAARELAEGLNGILNAISKAPGKAN